MLLIRMEICQHRGSTVKQINDVAYEQKCIKGDGACVYRSLSFSLCGNEDDFEIIINDCLTVFKHLPMLYYQGVSFAVQNEVNGDIAEYELYMKACIERLHRGEGLINEFDKLFWGEDGHIQAISLLYNITVFVCSENIEDGVVRSRWRAFNKEGSAGYVCLLSAHDHVSVLLGTDDNITPSRPMTDIVSGYSRSSSGLGWDTAGRNMCATFREPFPFVWRNVLCITGNVNTNNEVNRVEYVCVLCRNRQFKTNASFTKHMKTYHRSKAFATVKQLSADMKREAKCKTKNERKTQVTMFKCIAQPLRSTLSIDSSSCNDAMEANQMQSEPCMEKERYVQQISTVRSSASAAENESIKHSQYVDTMNSYDDVYSNKVTDDDPLLQPIKKSKSKAKKPTSEKCTTENVCSVKKSTRLMKRKRTNECSFASNDKSGTIEREDINLNHVLHINSTPAKKPKTWRNKHSRAHQFTDPNSKASKRKRQASNLTDESMQEQSSAEYVQSTRKCITNLNVSSKHSLQSSHSSNECTSGFISNKNTNSKISSNNWAHDQSRYYKEKRQEYLDRWKARHWPRVISDSNKLINKLETYVRQLKRTANDISTKVLSPEVNQILVDSALTNNELRKIVCNKADLDRLTNITNAAKLLPDSKKWTWNAKLDFKSKQSMANDERMNIWKDYDMDIALLSRCKLCHCSDLLFGKDEHQLMKSPLCHDCMALHSRKSFQNKSNNELDTWLYKIKPRNKEFPKRTEKEHTHEYLPDLSAAEKAAIALVHPVTTIKKFYLWYKRFRCESITLSQNPDTTWAKLLPRTDLKGRFVIIERTVKNIEKKYICVDSERVRQWLLLLFDKNNGHHGVLERSAQGLLEMSVEAIEKLKTITEMAEVDVEDYEETEQVSRHTQRQVDIDENGINHASMNPILSENHVFAFEQKDRLYMNRKDVIKLKDKGMMQFVTDSSKRSLSYNVSAAHAFPHLYVGRTERGDNRIAPNECKNTAMAAKMLKKMMLFPLEYRSSSGTLERMRWFCAEDDVHMAHQYAAIDERRVNDKVGFFMHQRPETAAMDITHLLEALKQGANDQGVIDSNLPGLTQLLSTLHGSREFWYSERMGIETISRDLGDCNWFLTLNFDPRNDCHCRKLVWMLEHSWLKVEEVKEQYNEDWHFDSTEHFSAMMDKHAVFISMLMAHKFETFMDALCDVCQIPKHQKREDWTRRQEDSIENGWYFARVEFTETRGVAHYHVLLHLPNVLPTSLLGRVIQNGRVVRNELKYGNIRDDCLEQAWQMIEMGLLAQQYAINFVESVSMTSFYTEQMPCSVHNEEKVINLDALCAEYCASYKEGNISKLANPLMRQPGDKECDSNRNVEIAKVASVVQLHACLPDRCGGSEDEKKDGKAHRTCRFDYPKKLVKHSVVTMVQINTEQMEAQVLLRRTHSRVNNIHPLIAFYWRANHDSTGLIDAAHSKRYCTKYASKSSKHREMYVQLLEDISKRGLQNLRNNVRHVLVQVFLASCSHRTFMSKLEIAHRVMQLPMVLKSYSNVEVVSCYWRATLIRNPYEKDVWVYSDRTALSAYAERFDKETVYKNCTPEEKEELQTSNFKAFCETARWEYKRKSNIDNTKLYKKHQLKSCEKGTGHWIISKCRGRGHVRFSTTLNTDLACNYVPIDRDNEASYSDFMSMPTDKRRQLVRSYYELTAYVPWRDHPDKTFLSDDVLQDLDSNDPESGHRYSLQRCEKYYEVYEQKWKHGEVAKPGSAWHTDNQHAYTLYLVHGHNSDLKLQRADNDGRFNALLEPAEELAGVDVDVRPMCSSDSDDSDYPSVDNFLPYDIYSSIMQQIPITINDISVAYPSQPHYRNIEKYVRGAKTKRFLADPPCPKVRFNDLGPLQQKFVNLAVSGTNQVLYLTGVAGSGKTEVLLHILQQLKGRVQACATTGIAARNLNAPTLHGMLGISQTDCDNSEMRIDAHSTKCQNNAVAYADIDVFVIDEVNMLPAHVLGFVNELMTKSFNPQYTEHNGKLQPFGGKRVILVGDPAQLPPVNGKPFFLPSIVPPSTKRFNDLRLEREQTGLQLYIEHMRPNVTILQQSRRNTGLLAEIADSLRAGVQTRQQLGQLQLQYRRHCDELPDRGVHYTNEAAASYNLRDLWRRSQLENKRVFVCKASYYQTDTNQRVVASLSAIPAKHYNFAPDMLCVYVGCEVRLVTNIDVAAGLVNGAIGRVVKVVYDAVDTKFVIANEHVPPAYLIVDFAEFRGFQGNSARFPFTQHPTWVPLVKEKFTIMARNVPRNTRAEQSIANCWRMQFPVDVSLHITTHRSQGSTLANQTILVDLDLQNPSNNLADNAGAMLYVSITRASALKYLLVAPIFPAIWDELCKQPVDDERRKEEGILRDHALHFAEHNGYRDIVDREFTICTGKNNDIEWTDLINEAQLPNTIRDVLPEFQDAEFVAKDENISFQFIHKASRSERFIGIDQGTQCNFAIVVVDKVGDKNPKIVFATVHDLKLPKRFTAENVVIALSKTGLLSWMQLPGHKQLETLVDKVFVQVEQMSIHNSNAKVFGIDLATRLQALCPDFEKVIVKLSQPNLHYASGPAFQLGQRIVKNLQMKPVRLCNAKYTSNPAVEKQCSNADGNRDEVTSSYHHRKQMSANIFKYILMADEEQLEDMKIDIDPQVKAQYVKLINTAVEFKWDDLGDATLHALRDLLCGSSNYKQAVPKVPSMYENRTIAVALFPDLIYWAVISCTWNSFACKSLGAYNWRSTMHNDYYLDDKFSDQIVSSILNDGGCEQLRVALTCMQDSDIFVSANHIKVVVKQQTAFDKRGIKTKQEAGALTRATVKAMRIICDKVMGVQDSELVFYKNKKTGTFYMRSNKQTGLKMQVVQSTGKHLNAVLSFLGWFRENLGDFVEQRRLILRETEKCKFFAALRDIARKDDNRLELLQLSDNSKQFLASNNQFVLLDEHARNLADIILVATSKNQQEVKAVALHYRQNRHQTSNATQSAQATNNKNSSSEKCNVVHQSRKRKAKNKNENKSKKPRLEEPDK
jgi:hypothetical protein